MIEVSNIRVALNKAGETEQRARDALCSELACVLSVKASALKGFELQKRSIDARKKNRIVLNHSVRLSLAPSLESELVSAGKVRAVDTTPPLWPSPAGLLSRSSHNATSPISSPTDPLFASAPVVVGAGCAGLFCALALARAGAHPLLIERGDNAARRTQLVREHNESGILDSESNIQFGLGGAGTFSDGKLATGTRSPYHRLILDELVSCGASQQILWDGHPHVGSDVLPTVVTNIVKHIEDAGGTVLFRTRMTDLELIGNQVGALRVESQGVERRIACSQLVLACGHSARDVFALLHERGVALERKPFAMGVRIESLQADVDHALYGSYAGHPLLGAAPYKSAVHLPNGRSAFTFCMCPGGHVVSAASEAGGVCINGASLSARDGINANAGLLVGVEPDDLDGTDVLAGVELQRHCEQAAYERGGGAFVAPAQLVGDFCRKQASNGVGGVRPSYPRGVYWGSIEDCLPSYVSQTLREALPLMGRKLPVLSADDSVLTAVETRSSSPVRVVRGADGQSVSTRGLFPVGEGAGYAGGIMSAAADGIRAALHLLG